jgi:hypothetical protein
MPESIPNLAGIATKDLVETIGTGNYKASYINWARTFNLLHQHAPGWYLEMVLTNDGSQVWPASGNGGSLMLRFCHIDGTMLAPVPQAIMDNRNNSIPLDKITSRDITDTHRRGGCLVAAMAFGLGHELWAKMPLESGYNEVSGHEAATSTPVMTAPTTAPATETKESFLEAALSKGLSTHSADALLAIINGNYASGIRTLAGKDLQWVDEFNKKNTPAPVESAAPAEEEAKPEPVEGATPKATPATRAKKTTPKPDASEY